MNIDFFIKNAKKYCELKGVKPTVACAESGAGKDMLTNLSKRGIIPSIERVQLLAQYLGCTVSDLLGERPATWSRAMSSSTPIATARPARQKS